MCLGEKRETVVCFGLMPVFILFYVFHVPFACCAGSNGIADAVSPAACAGVMLWRDCSCVYRALLIP